MVEFKEMPHIVGTHGSIKAETRCGRGSVGQVRQVGRGEWGIPRIALLGLGNEIAVMPESAPAPRSASSG